MELLQKKGAGKQDAGAMFTPSLTFAITSLDVI